MHLLSIGRYSTADLMGDIAGWREAGYLDAVKGDFVVIYYDGDLDQLAPVDQLAPGWLWGELVDSDLPSAQLQVRGWITRSQVNVLGPLREPLKTSSCGARLVASYG